MKILIVGLGTIGTLYGWAFSEAGYDVTHLIRTERLEKYQQGIGLDIYDQRPNYPTEQITVYKAHCVDDSQLTDNFDLVMIPTKSYQLIDTIKQLNGKLLSATFLIFCAYWGELTTLDQLLPGNKYLFGYSGSTGGYAKGNMQLNIKSKYRIGSHANRSCEKLDEILKIFSQAGFKADCKKDMLKWLWTHHAIVAGLMGTALFAGMSKDFIKNPIFAKNFVPAVKEALKVAKQRGCDFDDDPEAQIFLMDDQQQAYKKFCEAFLNDKAGQRALKTGHHLYAQDEMKQFYLDVLQMGRLLTIDMPVLESYKEKLCR